MRRPRPKSAAANGAGVSEARWIDHQEDLQELLAVLSADPIGLDLEADSFHHYREKVCLVQVAQPAAGGAGVALIDPLAGVSLAPLAAVLADRGWRKVLHGADYDLRLLDRDHGLKVAGLFDTMVAARLVGERSFGLASLLEQRLGVKLDKRHQRADWSVRPLPASMAEYAVADTRHLPALADQLEEDLVRSGRASWAVEEFRRLEQVRWTAASRDAESWTRIKGRHALDRRGLAVLREVHAFRDAVSRARDVPWFRVFRDDAAVEIARRKPLDAAALARIPGLPRAVLSPAAARELVSAVARALSLPSEELPELPSSKRSRPTPEHEREVKRLLLERDRIAAELGIEPAVVAPRAALEAAAARKLAGEEPSEVPDLREWQRDLMQPAFT